MNIDVTAQFEYSMINRLFSNSSKSNNSKLNKREQTRPFYLSDSLLVQPLPTRIVSSNSLSMLGTNSENGEEKKFICNWSIIRGFIFAFWRSPFQGNWENVNAQMPFNWRMPWCLYTFGAWKPSLQVRNELFIFIFFNFQSVRMGHFTEGYW